MGERSVTIGRDAQGNAIVTGDNNLTTTTRRCTTAISASSARSIPRSRRWCIEFDGRPVTYGFGELDDVVLANATTIHKSQGSEYPAVVIPLATQHYPMLRRNRSIRR